MLVILQGVFLFLALLVILLLIWEVRFNFIRRKWPPGPRGSPFIGNLKELELGSLLEKFKELRKEYGNVFTITVLHRPLIIANGYEALRHLLCKEGDSTPDRPPYLTEHNPDLLGIVSSSGALWKEHRSFGLKTLKELGLGKQNIYDKIELEASVLISDILKSDDEQLKITLGEFFNAGTESVTSTLRWALVYLVHYQEVQRNMQQEIDDVIGRSRMPMMTDKDSLP
ncbi:hypothetical protein FSP39_007703 [Pinctada imbricata]|uniref:Uncharacterized protein n=1 Tax=Pinctada imbricata TaxID=66713 RepID=A0AA89C3F7_PINIB|nr:hypothetical protein FSP39_007703 [Pinctada imbricata]